MDTKDNYDLLDLANESGIIEKNFGQSMIQGPLYLPVIIAVATGIVRLLAVN